jgi:hypothetical protein
MDLTLLEMVERSQQIKIEKWISRSLKKPTRYYCPKTNKP